MPTRIAVAQVDVTLGDVAANEARARRALAESVDHRAELVVFPELQLSGYALGSVEHETATRPDELLGLCAETGSAALLGFHEQNGSARFNSAAFVDQGSLVHVHRKLYLTGYEPFAETAVFSPGGSLRAFDTGIGRVAILICSDAWQPALPVVAVQDGAEILLIPSASPTVVPHVERYWRDLTRFYAQMLECYVVFANRVGEEGGFRFWGGSHVVDPLGTVVAEAPRFEEALLVADIDLAQVRARRAELPLLDDPRLDLLRDELGRLAR